MTGDVLDIITGLIEASGITIRRVAEMIGKPYPTLKRELNEYDDGAKLGARDLLPVARCCPGGLEALARYYASRAGMRCIDLHATRPDKPTFDAELLDDFPALTALHDAMESGRPLEVVQRLLGTAIDEIEQDFMAYCAKATQRAAEAGRRAS